MENSKYNVDRSQVAAIGDGARADNNTFNSYPEVKKTIAEAAHEIQSLLKQLEKNNPAATEPEQLAYVQVGTNLDIKKRAIAALKAGGETAIDEFVLENKYLKVVKAIFKAWLQ
jgi:hypothetical protein